jgi:hypothetical protein
VERRAIADEKRRLSGRQTETAAPALPSSIPEGPVSIVERAHPDLGRLGVFWHTQGSGKSYSMAYFAEKVRRKVPGNFTFLLMTDRHDLDDQIYKTFAGSGITGKDTPRAATRDDLERLLKENHPYIFSLIHKFNKDVDPKHPYSERDDIIVNGQASTGARAGAEAVVLVEGMAPAPRQEAFRNSLVRVVREARRHRACRTCPSHPHCVLKIEIGKPYDFDRPSTRQEALDRLERTAGPEARAMLERFLDQVAKTLTATKAYRRAELRRYRWPGSARGGVSITSAAGRVRVWAPLRDCANRLQVDRLKEVLASLSAICRCSRPCDN